MPLKRPPTSGYARIAQAEEEEEELLSSEAEHDDAFHGPPTISSPNSSYAPVQPPRREPMQFPPDSPQTPRRPRRRRANSTVDIKAINARLERWAEEIKQRFKRRGWRGKSAQEERLEIHHSVFQAPEWIRPATKASMESEYDDSELRMSKMEFDDIVESVRTAIELGMHPKLISQGSSGSYFARNSGGKVLGVFKPKDEEPYASKNPKWTKWIHRNLFPFAFGRACLIPNLSYVSEAASYVLDVQLRTNLVPYTAVVSLGSKSFFYDFWDRRAYYRKRKPLPEKQGSFQVFLKGFKGATEFLQEHPWPDQHSSSSRDTASAGKRRRRRWAEDCRPGSAPAAKEEESDFEESGIMSNGNARAEGAFWTAKLQESFREQLEKLVILDYIMRNTDRGTDNWMIRVDKEKNTASIVAEFPRIKSNDIAQDYISDQATNLSNHSAGYHRRDESMTATPPPEDDSFPRIGAIDNSLSWPWKHPDAWRSYPFGWLFLPVSLIGRPFSDKTRRHFLPLLTSKDWWTDTQVKLRSTFEIDVDFKERMFARQIAVMKGQAWNVVETLKTPDHGPLELTRRSRVCVWDDLVDIPVAVPLHRQSEDMRRGAVQAQEDARKPIEEEEGEEMDISAAHSSYAPAPQHENLRDLSSLSKTRPENPFNHSRQNSNQDISVAVSSPRSDKEPSLMSPKPLDSQPPALRPIASRSRTGTGRMSYDGPRAPWHSPPVERRRRFSFNVGRRLSTSWASVGDEEDGDLGYAAVGERQNVTRKVIVERLEMVKSKPPVFSWC